MPSINQNKKYLGQGSEVPSWEQKLQGFMGNRPEIPPGQNDTYKSALAIGGGGAGMSGNLGRGRGFGRSGSFSLPPNLTGGRNNGLQDIFQELLRKRKKFGQLDQPPQPTQNTLLSRYLGGSE